MLGIKRKLNNFAGEGRSIKIAIAGAGQMGKGLISQLGELKGMQVLAIADYEINKAMATLSQIGINKDKIVEIRSKKSRNVDLENSYTVKVNNNILDVELKRKIDRAIKEEKIIISDNLSILFLINEIDVILDATGNPEAGAYIALNAISEKKHLVTLNVETDVTIGPILMKMANNAGVVYTVSAGDEPAALLELYDFADTLGLEIVAAGKGKNNPLDRYANPSTLEGYAKDKGSSAYMMTSFVDGTKSMVEMACLSNATGLKPDCRGMHGPKANISELADIFKLRKDGGILSKKGIVDFVIGDLAPGVFVVYTTKNKTIQAELKYLLFGDGPNYLLYRPYHLTSIESPISIALAYFYNEPTIVPSYGLVSEVITVAKKDLKAGETIDRIGGYTIYGLIDEYKNAKKEGMLPIGVAHGCTLKKDIEKDMPIKYSDVDLVEDSLVLRLRRLQDNMLKDV